MERLHQTLRKISNGTNNANAIAVGSHVPLHQRQQEHHFNVGNGSQSNGGRVPTIHPLPSIQITEMPIDEVDEEAAGSTAEAFSGRTTATTTTTECLEQKTNGKVINGNADGGVAPKAMDGQMLEGGQGGHHQDNPLLLCANKCQDRSAVNRQSTGTLNRLILVAQALENEVDWRRRNDVNSTRIIFTLRMANIVLLVLINVLMFSGVGQYHDREGMRISLFLTMDKWHFQPGYPIEEVPSTFSEMRLTSQFCAAAFSMAMLLGTLLLQCIHCLHFRHSKFLCIVYAAACVPVTLFIFGLEMHYSACPWLDDFYHAQLLTKEFSSMEKYFDTQCGINGWALAGIFSLLSCGLFVSDGLITAFFRADDLHGTEQEKPVAML